MHLLIPFAAPLSDAGRAALGTLVLPNLATLLARWSRVAGSDGGGDGDGDAFSLSTPHERALAAAWGWAAPDGLLPFAALAAADDGLTPHPGGPGWGLVQLSHWHADAQQVAVTDPAALRLDEAGARQFFDALAPLFGDDGWELHWGSATRWYATHASLATLPTASLDRVIGRDIDIWLQSHPDARKLRRLQAEAQMLLHAHPLNAEREARGALPVNSFWLSACGKAQPARSDGVRYDDRLRGPALRADAGAWRDIWQLLDSDAIAPLLARADRGEAARLTLCGERSRVELAPRPRSWWRGLADAVAPARSRVQPLLESL